MADLRTDYKDDVLDTSVNEERKYEMSENSDGTVSLKDVTEYLQEGDNFGADILNQIVAKITTDVIDVLADVLTNTEGGVLVGANAVKELKNTLQNAIDAKVTNSFTANRAVYVNANGNLAASGTVTDTELGYLNGVTSNIQTQLNSKATSASVETLQNTVNGKVTNNFAPSCALYSDANGKVAASGSVSATELGYLNGVTNNIQTQLNGKATLGGQPNFQGIHIGGAGAVGYIYPGGTDGNIWFRYQNASGQEHYTNMRNIPSCTVSGTTLNITLG